MPSSDLTLADLPSPPKELTLADLPVPPSNTEKPSWYADILKSVPSSFARASAGLVGMPQTMRDVATTAFEKTGLPDSISSAVRSITGKEPVQLKGPNLPNLGDVSLYGLKQLMGSTYHEPETTPGKIADFAAQNVLFGAKNPKDLLNAPQTLRSLMQGTAAGTAGEAVPDEFPKIKAAAQLLGGMSPITIEHALMSPDRATRNAANMLKKSMENTSASEWRNAERLFESSRTGKTPVPLMGPESFPGGSQVQQLSSDVLASPAGGSTMREFIKNRTEQAETAARSQVGKVGRNVGGQEAANDIQEAADEVVRRAQKARTEKSSPQYKAQRTSDREAIGFLDYAAELPQKISQLAESRNKAVQDAGKLYQFTMEQRNLAKQTAEKGMGWAGDVKTERHMDRFREGTSATQDTYDVAMQRRAALDASEKELYRVQDEIAKKNLPQVAKKVRSFLDSLDNEIRLVNPNTTEGKILKTYRDEIAPKGEALLLPSQLESVYKTNRDKLDLGLNATSADKTTAAVLKKHVKDLDSLIQDVSPAIKLGREIYQGISKEIVDPLLKGPIGKLAGKGADAQKEASYARMISEMQGPTATPDRIRTIAEKTRSVEPTAFPNMARAYFEERLNNSFKKLQGQQNPKGGANFVNAIEGTKEDRANVRAIIEEVAKAQGQKPGQAYQGFRKMLDVLDATGRIPGIGSQTQTRMENAAMARESAVAGALDLNVTHPGGTIAKWARDMVYRGTYRKLADVFTAPDSIKQMDKLATLQPKSIEAQRIVSTLLTSAAQRPKDSKDADSQ